MSYERAKALAELFAMAAPAKFSPVQARALRELASLIEYERACVETSERHPSRDLVEQLEIA